MNYQMTVALEDWGKAVKLEKLSTFQSSNTMRSEKNKFHLSKEK